MWKEIKVYLGYLFYLNGYFAGSKMVGWQLCSDVIYPLTLMGKGFPPLDPVLFTLRLQKLDKGLNQYLLEAAYTFVPQVGKISDICTFKLRRSK